MPNKIDLTHKTIGKLFVVGKTELKKGGQILWACHCDCKNFRLFTTNYLTKGLCVDCGCGALDRYSKANTKHGFAKRNGKLYTVYVSMMSRCYCETSKSYELYGARGIRVCDRWNDISNFFTDMEDTYQVGLSLDREDVNSDYSPENCSWKNNSWQNYNTRIKSNNSSGKTGVSFDTNSGKWAAYIQKDSKKIHLGSYSSLEDAIKARESAEIEYFGRLKGN